MGPGYFPVMLSGVTVVIGVVVMLRSLAVADRSGFGRVPWRAVVVLTAAIVLFGALIDRLGLLPGVFLSTALACLSSRQVGIATAAMVGAGLAVFCTLVFGFTVRVPIPILGSWFAG